MTEQNPPASPPIPQPVEGKTVFQITNSVRIRFNNDGWVEEMSSSSGDEPLGIRLQGRAGSGLDDIYARRYYDLCTRAVILDIHPKRSNDFSGKGGIVMFKDLEPGSAMYDRVNIIIGIANHHFKMNVKPLA